ncbi:MAG: hypothetical protein PQJ46_15770 [Spirochaetales bacterium]|nr:hypothetical protein [Spirochaetales bacterium]
MLIQSCTFFRTNSEIQVLIPCTASLEQKCRISSYIIEYPVSIYDDCVVYSSIEAICFDSSKDLLVDLNITRGVNLPILAYPVFTAFSDTGCFSFQGSFPAAAIYPLDVENSSLELSWSNGFEGFVLKKCSESTGIIKGFNTISFREAVAEKVYRFENSDTEPVKGGGWIIDSRNILSRLAYGVFRESSITKTDMKNFLLPVTGGSYISDNFLYGSEESISIDYDCFIQVCIIKDKTTSFMNLENGEVVSVYFNDSYWCFTNYLTGQNDSGRF